MAEPNDPLPAGFASLGLSDALVAAVTALGYEEPTPIQREAIPVLLSGRDVLGQAETGTGKTAAFALPMLQRVSQEPAARGQTLGLVLVPTRELAMQVAEAVHKYAKKLGSRVVPVYGGASMDQQIRALRHGAEVVVATPGRALDHIRRQTLALEGLRFLVLDEADEMLDMGFAEELEAILEATPRERQTALFSATLPSRIVAIAEKHLRNPVRVTLGRAKTSPGKLPRVRQVAYVVSRAHKAAALARVLDMESPASAIVFCRTRLEVETLVESLNAHGYRAEALHGGLVQRQRDRVMTAFRATKVDLLVATDVAARGLDIEHLSHVFNYDVPSTPEAYVHRIGRTGRVGRTGVAITLAEPREHRLLRFIEGFTKQKIEVATVPTVAELRARRLDLTKASLREQLLGGGLDEVRVVVESLAEEFDVLDIAAAGVKLAHAATVDGGDGEGTEREIPSAIPFERPRPGPNRDRFPPKGGRGGGPPFRPARRPAGEPVTRIHVSAGRQAGVRPGDLVGAITGEAGIGSREIGAIEIADRFSLVEVPERLANAIVSALRASTIKGKKVAVRREKDGPGKTP
ncbi:MAG: DEAD/DEAH box helicase [Acidobacteriota bacterium]